MQQFPHTVSKTEFIEPFIRPPWWLPKAQITIAETKDDAKAMHDKILQNTCPETTRCIYTDGSGIQGKIGAATFELATNTATQQHLGGENHFNVFAAEASALATAAELALHSNWPKRNIIFTDSQAAAKAVDNPWRQSGQSIIKRFLNMADKLKNLHSIQIIWIPGHKDIEGNERADKEAKEAAIKEPPPRLGSPEYPPMKAALSQQIKIQAKRDQENEWKEGGPRAIKLRRMTRHRDVRSGPKLYNLLERQAATTLAQLRTGHCGLNHYLHRFNLKESPYCECGYGKETVEHYLMECRRYKEQRKEMHKEIHGSLGKWRTKLERLLGDPKVVKHTLKFVTETARFKTM